MVNGSVIIIRRNRLRLKVIDICHVAKRVLFAAASLNLLVISPEFGRGLQARCIVQFILAINKMQYLQEIPIKDTSSRAEKEAFLCREFLYSGFNSGMIN